MLYGLSTTRNLDPFNINILVEEMEAHDRLMDAISDCKYTNASKPNTRFSFAEWVRYFLGEIVGGEFTLGAMHNSNIRLPAMILLWLIRLLFYTALKGMV